MAVTLSKSPSDSDPNGICVTINKACGAEFRKLEDLGNEHKELLKGIDTLIRGDGNGNPGFAARLRSVEAKIGATGSIFASLMPTIAAVAVVLIGLAFYGWHAQTERKSIQAEIERTVLGHMELNANRAVK